MINFQSILITADSQQKNLESLNMSLEEAKAKIKDLIDNNGKRRSFLDISKPEMLVLTHCDDPAGELSCAIFAGPGDEMQALKLFALKHKAERKRKDNATGDLAKPSEN